MKSSYKIAEAEGIYFTIDTIVAGLPIFVSRNIGVTVPRNISVMVMIQYFVLRHWMWCDDLIQSLNRINLKQSFKGNVLPVPHTGWEGGDESRLAGWDRNIIIVSWVLIIIGI